MDETSGKKELRKLLWELVALAALAILTLSSFDRFLLSRPLKTLIIDWFLEMGIAVVLIVYAFRKLSRLQDEIYSREEELRASEEKYRAVAEMANDAIVVVQDSLLKFANPKAIEIYGGEVSEILGKEIYNFLAPEYVELVRKRHRARLSGEDVPSIYEVELINKSGKRVPVEFNVGVINYGGKPGVIVVMRDLRERRRVKELIRKERDFSRTIIETADALIIGLDLEGRIVLFNRKCEEVTGYSKREILGRVIWDALIPERCLEGVKKVFESSSFDQLPSRFENPWLTKSGEERMISWHTTNVKDAEGNINLVLGIGIDITEQRKLEERMLQSEKLASIGELVSGVAHELNNPLTSILGYSQILLGKARDIDLRKDLERIADSAERASKIVRNLLTFARRREPDGRKININEVLENTIELRTYDPKCSDIKIVKEFSPDIPPVSADFHQLQQVFLNLIVNAEQAISSARKGSTIRIKTEEIGRNVRITVSDDGPGISRENLRKIFDPFFTTKEQGTGLGLSISYGIVKDHGGEIWAESQEGKGTIFFIELPISGT